MTRASKWSLSCCFQVAAGPTALAGVPSWKPKAWPRCRCTSTDEVIYRYPMLVGDWIAEVSQIKECCAMILHGWRVKEVGCLSQIVHFQIEVWIETKWRTWKRRAVLQCMRLLGWWSSADVANRSLDWNVWFSRCKAPCRERAFMLLRPGAEGSPEQNRSAQIGLVGQTVFVNRITSCFRLQQCFSRALDPPNGPKWMSFDPHSSLFLFCFDVFLRGERATITDRSRLWQGRVCFCFWRACALAKVCEYVTVAQRHPKTILPQPVKSLCCDLILE